MARRDTTDVIASAAAGDEITFHQLIAEHQEDMRRVSSYVLGESALAEEATQAAWVVASKKIGTVPIAPPQLPARSVPRGTGLISCRSRLAARIAGHPEAVAAAE